MAYYSSFVLMIITLVLCLTTFFSTSKAAGDLITTICSKTEVPPSCEKALRSDPRSAGSDLRGLGQIATDIAFDATNSGIEVAKAFSKVQGPKGAAGTCVEVLGYTIDNLNSCKSLLSARDIDINTLQDNASAADTFVETCLEGYDEGHDPYPLPDSLYKPCRTAITLINALLVIASEMK